MTEVDSQYIISQFSGSTYQYKFANCRIVGKFIYTFSSRNTIIEFEDCEIEEEIDLRLSLNSNSSVSFQNVIFKKSINIDIKRGAISFSGCRIMLNLFLIGEEAHLSLINTQLNGDTKIKGSFREVHCRISIGDEIRGKVFDFSGNHVLGMADFSDSQFPEIRFSNTVFGSSFLFMNSISHGGGAFANVHFSKEANFHKSILWADTIFNGSLFEDILLFEDAISDGEIDFSGAIFKKRVFFDRIQFKKLTIQHSTFSQIVSFKRCNINQIAISKAVFEEGTDFLHAKISYGDRETFRIIKNELLKINNNVDALHYKSKEMAAYEMELAWRAHFWNKFLIILNRLSNNHGVSWSRGLFFTLLVGALFYGLYLSSLGYLPFQWGWRGWDSFWRAAGTNIKYFIRFFIITHDLDFMKEYKPSAGSFIVDFVGKIFIGYGIYQTVQAFRKHGKS
jgi:uncharacterized protein YjbI with pentapeptide repeats